MFSCQLSALSSQLHSSVEASLQLTTDNGHQCLHLQSPCTCSSTFVA